MLKTRAISYIGLGSNLSNPLKQIQTAYKSMSQLPASNCLSLSPLYKSKAVGPEQPDYVNAVAKLETSLLPIDLLDELQKIELKQKRVRNQRWGPRTIDLDILLFDQMSFITERLSIPHPYITERNFVLAPLLDLAPEIQLPDGQKAQSLLKRCGLEGLTPLIQ